MVSRGRWTARLLLLAVAFAVVVGAAAAASAPTVTTGPVTAVGPTTATCFGLGQPERHLDELVCRVRHGLELRLEDVLHERRIRYIPR